MIIYFYCKEFKVKNKSGSGNNIEKHLYLKILHEVFNKKLMISKLYKILDNESEEKTILISSFPEKKEKVYFGINNSGDVNFSNLYYNIIEHGNKYILKIPTSIISEGYGNNSDIIWKWCEKKYNFIKNSII